MLINAWQQHGSRQSLPHQSLGLAVCEPSSERIAAGTERTPPPAFRLVLEVTINIFDGDVPETDVSLYQMIEKLADLPLGRTNRLFRLPSTLPLRGKKSGQFGVIRLGDLCWR
jgi:hypothetical protein